MNISRPSDIPNTPYYVLCDDPFMSGWGPARQLINTLILPCASPAEAGIVRANARARGDMKRVRITTTKPRLRPGHLYSLHTKEDYPRWYEAGFFKPPEHKEAFDW